jgi:hypothetical protein
MILCQPCDNEARFGKFCFSHQNCAALFHVHSGLEAGACRRAKSCWHP